MNSWSLRGTAAAVGIAAVIAGVGGAAVYAATDSGPRMMGMHGGPGPGLGDRPGMPPRDDIAREAAPDSASVHGEFVVADGTGGFTTMISQTGRVTAISDTAVTARSDDGYSQTYVIPAGNLGGLAATPPFAVDDEVTIRATRTGQTVSVTTIAYARTRGGPIGPPLAPGHP
jgi:hypothetical protein